MAGQLDGLHAGPGGLSAVRYKIAVLSNFSPA